MRLRSLLLVLLLALVLLLSFAAPQSLHASAADQITASPTPTYDPLVEPSLSPDPSELELGRNLFWHWCMPCHGDRGQGLTDEFRGIWEPDHRDCWARGCHGGRPRDEGFPIPTFVPALVVADQLAKFGSVEELVYYLTMTHPPQSPGILEADEYHSIAAYVFSLNGLSPNAIPSLSTSTPQVVSTGYTPSLPPWIFVFVACIISAILITFLANRSTHLHE